MVYKIVETYAYEHDDSGFDHLTPYTEAVPDASKRSTKDFWEYFNEDYHCSLENFGRYNEIEYETEEAALKAYEKRIEKYFKEMEQCFREEELNKKDNFYRELDRLFFRDEANLEKIKELFDETKEEVGNLYPTDFMEIPAERYFPADIELFDDNGRLIKSLETEEKPYDLKWKTILEMQICHED